MPIPKGWPMPPVPIFDAEADGKTTAQAKWFTDVDAYRAIAKSLPTARGITQYGPRMDFDGVVVSLADRKYLALDEQGWLDVLKAMPARNKYVAERYDCDDFSKWFAGYISHRYEINGCGRTLDLSGEHSYNIVLVYDGDELQARFVEPQEDKFVPLGSHHHIMTQGMIII